MDVDAVIVGSGFGGSVAALRLAQKGHRVVVLEQGLRVDERAIAAAATDPTRLMWAPRLRMRGFFAPRVFRHLVVLGGVGVGGGSLVYAAVLLQPEPAFFEDAAWGGRGAQWARELAPFYDVAARMLGAQRTATFGVMDEHLRRTAEAMGASSTFGPTTNGIHFGAPGVEVDDPYFGGEGPRRRGCTLCGGCINGCPTGAKNSLDKNYLHLAERSGAAVIPRVRVTHVEPVTGGYRVHAVDALTRVRLAPRTASRVVLAAGVLGTLEILFRSRDTARTLPLLSKRLGQRVRTNSEAIVGALGPEGGPDVSADGATISSHFHLPADRTHVTQNRVSRGSALMRFQMGPLVDGARPGRRALATLGAFVRSPRRATAAMRARDWHQRTTLLTVMQTTDTGVSFRWSRGGLGSEVDAGLGRAPSYLAVANDIARSFAQVTGGEPMNLLAESVFDRAITAHVLGGAAIGDDAEHGVIDARHEVFGYPGLYVVDGAAVPANVGVNPSLTITAMAERAMSLLPARTP